MSEDAVIWHLVLLAAVVIFGCFAVPTLWDKARDYGAEREQSRITHALEDYFAETFIAGTPATSHAIHLIVRGEEPQA